jgi:hypothetical protein
VHGLALALEEKNQFTLWMSEQISRDFVN